MSGSGSHATHLPTLAARLLLAGACWLAGMSSALAQACPEESAGAAAALRVYVDPDTGELLEGPPPGTPAEPTPEAPAAEPDIPVTVRPDGTVLADVGDHFRTELRAEIVDGRLVTCHGPVSDEAGAGSADDPQRVPDRDPDR